MPKTHAESIAELFDAFTIGVGQARAELYVDKVSHVAPEVLEAACDWFVRHSERTSPPPIAQLLARCTARPYEGTQQDERSAKLDTELRYILPRLSDVDYHRFKRAYRVEPNRALYDRIGVEPGPEQTFKIPPEEVCEAMHRRAVRELNEAVHRMYRRATPQRVENERSRLAAGDE